MIGRCLAVENAGTAERDGNGQDRDNRVVEAIDFVVGQRPGQPFRMEAGAVERFVNIDVAEAGQKRLIEQQRLESGQFAGTDALM